MKRATRDDDGKDVPAGAGSADPASTVAVTPATCDPDLDLRDAIQRIALEFPSYGRPRITASCGGAAGG